MTLIGAHLIVFGGTDESISYNDVHTLHVDTMTWEKPVVYGTLPSPRARHTATAVGANLVVFGGVGGGNELHILETDNATWYVPKVTGEAPPPRFGHTATLVDSPLDQSRKIYIFGGHDGRKSLSDLYLFDTESMSWARANHGGRAPVAGSRHTVTLVEGEQLFVFGASDSGSFADFHVLDLESLTWSMVTAGGSAPTARARHTATLVGRNLVLFGGVGGGRPLNDVFVMHTAGGNLREVSWTEPPTNGLMPNARVGHATALVGCRMVVFGGHDGQMCMNDVHVLVTMNWSAIQCKGARPSPRLSCTMTTVDKKIYMVGGAAHDKPLNDVRTLDLQTKSWSVCTVTGTPPRALVGHSTSLVGRELFVFGGSDGKHDGNDLYIFDTETLAWSLPSLEGRAPLARIGHSSCLVGHTKLYYFGGYGIRIGYVNETHVLDTALLSWSRPYVNGTPPSPRVGHAACVLGTRMYVLGGAAHGFAFKDLFVLDTAALSWLEPQAAGQAPGGLYGHTALAFGRCIFVFGGCSEVPAHGILQRRIRASSRIHILDIETMTWSKPNVAGTSPLPRYRHACAMAGSQMLLFGGLGGGMELLALDTGIVDHDADTSATQDMVVGRGRRRGGRKSTAGSDDESDLVAWLDGLGLGKYSRIFVRQEVDFGTLAELTADDLREMGITALGPRKKLAAAISALRTMGKGKYSTSELCVAAPGPALLI